MNNYIFLGRLSKATQCTEHVLVNTRPPCMHIVQVDGLNAHLTIWGCVLILIENIILLHRCHLVTNAICQFLVFCC